MRKTFKVPYMFSYGGSLGRKTKHLQITFIESNGNIVIDSVEGDSEGSEIFRSEIMGSYGKRSTMENYLKKVY